MNPPPAHRLTNSQSTKRKRSYNCLHIIQKLPAFISINSGLSDPKNGQESGKPMVGAARSQWRTVSRQAHHCFTFTINYLLQGRLSPNSCHAVLAFILPLLVAFLALKYVGKVVTPFETHPKTMQFAIGSLLVYCLAYGAQLSVQSSIYVNAFGRFMELFGSLSMASLASIFFPDPAQWAFFASCTIFWAGDFLYSPLQMVWKWMHRTVADRLLRLLPAQESVVPQTSINDSNEEITSSVK